MTEFDFDELDKAVNSLMGGMKTAKSADRVDPAKTLTINATLAPDETPEYNKLGEVAQKIGSEAIDPTMINKTELSSTLAPGELPSYDKINAAARQIGSETLEDARSQAVTKRSGRFMDVMHPSSDMKTAMVSSGSAAPALSIPSRSPQVDATPMAIDASITTNSTASLTEAVSNDSTANANDLIAAQTPETPVSSTGISVSPVATPVSDDSPPAVVKKEVSEEAAAAITSPFLTDAKVEKRPLGGSNTEEAGGNTQESVTWPDASKVGTEDIQLNPSVGDASIVPDEFNNDLLAIETTQLNSIEPAAAAAEPVSSDVPQSDSPRVAENTSAIYDVKEYHAPLKHPAKKSSGWLWIIITIVIMAVCGGIGAATYLLLK